MVAWNLNCAQRTSTSTYARCRVTHGHRRAGFAHRCLSGGRRRARARWGVSVWWSHRAVPTQRRARFLPWWLWSCVVSHHQPRRAVPALAALFGRSARRTRLRQVSRHADACARQVLGGARRDIGERPGDGDAAGGDGEHAAPVGRGIGEFERRSAERRLKQRRPNVDERDGRGNRHARRHAPGPSEEHRHASDRITKDVWLPILLDAPIAVDHLRRASERVSGSTQ